MASAPSSSHIAMQPWPPEPTPPVGYLSRKALPIKRNDAEPLTREDVQFDLLNYIFSDMQAVFTSPTPKGKVTFSELYVSALYNSSKCSKVLKDKMVETPAFALEFAKISLLTNVGRINTTMAFFPEMKTALRTYHPVPSLQKTDGNAQDAPRIKNCLKAALLQSELRAVPPSTPEEILSKLKAGQHPPTSVVNLVFVLANHAAPLASVHFDGCLNFLDLFLPNKDLSSADRARAFLWLLYHYLENPTRANPFDDDFSRQNPGKAPLLRHLTREELKAENVDTLDEIAWGKKMSGQRNLFLQRLVSATEPDKKIKSSAPQFVAGSATVQPRAPQMHRVSEYPAVADTPHREQRWPRNEATDEGRSFSFYVHGRQLSSVNHRNQVPQPRPQLRVRSTGSEDRTMLQQAWHIVNSKDPLVHSDDEIADDDRDFLRSDYQRRLDVLQHISVVRASQ